MSMLQVLLHKLINFVRRITAHSTKSRPDVTLLELEAVNADEIDLQLMSDIEAGLDIQGDPHIVFHSGRDITEFVDEETLQMLDADWDEAKTACTG